MLLLLGPSSIARADVIVAAVRLGPSATFSGLTHIPVLIPSSAAVQPQAPSPQSARLAQLDLPVVELKRTNRWIQKLQPSGLTVGTQMGAMTSDPYQHQRFVEWNRHAQMPFFETVRADQMMIRLAGEF
ncbi:MAG: hypothetical protein A2289_12440 [Deltaproteobacteria bacterium RIFOXYA12_FULL_58_15]|nr:MAG: hypothetical protein A2289_12440 [Deltaproteobacteria bacterium RIFOXYA12_FULL_58_15]